jgi:hypothetical protein
MIPHKGFAFPGGTGSDDPDAEDLERLKKGKAVASLLYFKHHVPSKGYRILCSRYGL